MERGLYVSQREGAYWVGDTRVSLDSIAYEFLDGQVALAASGGFSAAELRTVEDLVSEQRQHFLEEWNAFFRGRS